MKKNNPTFNYIRRQSSIVFIGKTPLGGENPIRIQSMTNTSTMNTESCIRQTIGIIEAGGEYVRLTAQGVREAENLKNIKHGLRELGYNTPLVADIHFNPRAAETAAQIVEKVRINPGNFADPVKTFKTYEYSGEEYLQELNKIKERFIPFLNICKQHNTAIRIGVNHGSLSDRIMSRYGDTPQGMVESCMEFLRICVSENFTNVVISIKASNTFVMVRTVRLLVEQMRRENMAFPLHLGVTEAGEGEDGRIKSAVGIGTLLLEGIGDTIRVSLSEDPETEIPVARLFVDYIKEKTKYSVIEQAVSSFYNPFDPLRRNTKSICNIGGMNPPVVISDRSFDGNCIIEDNNALLPDYIYIGDKSSADYDGEIPIIVDYTVFTGRPNTYPLFTLQEEKDWLNYNKGLNFICLSYQDWDEKFVSQIKKNPQSVIFLHSEFQNIYEQKALLHQLIDNNITNPVVLRNTYNEKDKESFQIKSAIDSGSFFLDMLADGIMLSNQNLEITTSSIDECSFGILQASGRRITKTEYISCPGCGRTLFDLHSVIKKIKEATSHLKGMKIAIMGCIVNGPGEMADADYGYVGAGAGKVSLYKGKECIRKNIPEENAVEELIQLITDNEKN
ncbi:4-hydroxy-3-methylbut-2-en-1-yl diphosphate synthase [Bacteroidales bacterium OttesenSCG-928-M06]|nr:4-hydroxy-3-methylbut-2-en-1-yl diphosphate synthase [Bacteroidales bacterium OttesenSCG-928-M06]